MKIMVWLLFLFFYLQASCAELVKIGFVDTAKVFEGYIKAKEFEAILNKEMEEKKKIIAQKEKEIDMLRQSLNAQPIFTERERLAREEELKRKVEELNIFVEKAKEELIQKEQSFTKTIIDEIHLAIKEIAIERGLSVVFDKENILYGSPLFDITERVIERLNKKYKK